MDGLPPLNAVRTFEVAGRLCSITEAAAELCVTPSAVSRQIRLLEEHLGRKLFIRQHRGVVLTTIGHQYLGDISKALVEVRRATSEAAKPRQRAVFTVRAPHSIAMRWLLPRLARFHAAHPHIDVKLHTSLTPPDFEREDLDAGVMLGRGQWKGLLSHMLIRNELIPVCAPHKARALRTPADLADETLLHVFGRPDDWVAWLGAAGVEHVDVHRGMKYESSALAYEAALEGYGIAIAQKALIDKDLQEGRLVTPFDLSVDQGDYTYYFVLPPEGYKRRSPALDTFRRWVRDVSLPRQAPPP
ncbi:transcriptional regulator GcvA [Bordetella bronchiseptica]|uniref:transcriptional regulator GcvA n=1 Tax=Bordetella bronchiseptica TaxID=518 RepID=UPI0002905DB9|nr:transcriptional regulator GcvA [Bordetella bronchiseptica]KDD52721.1 transcriptional regulator, LysR family [Bordetella bronchiseptica OSU553]AUL14404.1 LysR family transcriptional regulator [Bordetella bronchiseptica]AWP57494.1 LysR family transcriptional regulator [Bordetella bronchiseptica]AWQ04236.1 LysR family transcriptional regulator [Bordetella bronchiseptica]AZW29810.1 transcriptional regulator GcvA [Bordetella bronchiseptica]